MDLEPGVTLNMIIVAPWPMGGAPPIGLRGSIGDEPLSDSLRASKNRSTAVRICLSCTKMPTLRDEVRRSEPRANLP
jgi:hypothetical protein